MYKSNTSQISISWLPLAGLAGLAAILLCIAGNPIPLTAQETSPYYTADSVSNEMGMEFVRIEPGSMTVGRFEVECPEPPDNRDVAERVRWTDEEFARCNELARRHARPGFTVTIEEAFYMGKYPITQEEWESVMGENPSVFQGDMVEGNSARHPVDSVTWEDAQTFINALNEQDTTATYRLPTAFEWEYAGRAGAEEVLPWAEIRDYAWIQDIDKGTTHPVGEKKPNDWGLYDMLGNVWEWVEDYYNEKIYPDPNPPASGDVHVLKGGSFISDVTNATYFTHAGGPGNGYDVGFRIIREPN